MLKKRIHFEKPKDPLAVNTQEFKTNLKQSPLVLTLALKKIRWLGLLLISLALVSCSEESKFKSYLKDIGELTLPFYIDNLGKSIPPKQFDAQKYEQYKVTWGFEPAGYFKFNDSLFVVLEYSLNKMGYVPYLLSYNHRGERLDSLELFRFSEEALNYRITESAFIHKDKIEMTKTRSTFKRNKKGEILKKGFRQKSESYELPIVDGHFKK